MKTINLMTVIFLFVSVITCNAQTMKQEAKAASSDKVEAYYFHFNVRCVTCKTIEAETKADIESLYGGKVSFRSVNLDDESSKPLAGKLGIAGQTLLLVKGDTKVNITNEGFRYARTNPEKFKSIIKEKIDGLIK